MLKVWYTSVFSLAGKINFERLHMDLMNNVQIPIIDRFIQVRDNNTFAYMGPERE